MPLHVDRQNLPLLRLRYVGTYTDHELQRFLAQVTAAVLEAPGRKVCLIDCFEANKGTASQRRLQTEWVRAHEEVLARDFAAAAVVASNALVRGAVTAIFWIRPLPCPTKVLATVEEAEKWLAPYLLQL